MSIRDSNPSKRESPPITTRPLTLLDSSVPFQTSFFFIFGFSILLTARKIADDWLRTADLWCLKQLVCKLSHNHCPTEKLFIPIIMFV